MLKRTPDQATKCGKITLGDRFRFQLNWKLPTSRPLFRFLPMRSPMRQIRTTLALLIGWLGCVSLAMADGPADKQSAAWRLIAGKCAQCHGGEDPPGKLDLTTREALQRGGESGAAIDEKALDGGSIDSHPLWQRVVAGEMPPNKPLSEADQAVLREWLLSGANYPREPLDPNAFSTSEHAGYDWWALQPNRVRWEDGTTTEYHIDRLIDERLTESKLKRSPPVDKASLLRRVTFDLTGLPPTPQEIDSFVQDESPDAYEKRVNRLLASSTYGERQARMWLDVAHFGESDGFEYDRIRPTAWRYRDWVIDAFNSDLPYNQFVKLQIAGDVMAPNDHAAVVAAGFLVHGAHDSLLPAFEAQRKVMRQDELEDIVGLVGQSFLGLTVHCARCHDHKFDPISQVDYYRLAAVLGGVKRGEREVPALPLPEEIASRLKKQKERLDVLTAMGRERVIAAFDAEGGPIAGPAPTPMAAWNFTDGLKDQVGQLHCRLEGKAKQTPEGLILDGTNAFAVSAPLQRELKEKTLEAWVKVDDLGQQGGGAISIQSRDGGRFDAIVYGEREPNRWMAGSEGFVRTQSFKGTAENDSSRPVHFVIVYSVDGRITGYRNGELYGEGYQSNGPPAFPLEQTEVLFGMRHGPVGANKMLKGTIVRAALYDRALSAEEVSAAASSVGRFVTEKGIQESLGSELGSERERLQKEVTALETQMNDRLHPKAYTITPQPAPETHRLARGNPASPREPVNPGGLTAVAKIQGKLVDLGGAQDSEGQRRIRLAEWIASPENPLTARVIVNRIWQQQFGNGLIETPSDFGFNGGHPTHPELLDGLASRFVAEGWSLKRLHKSMVLSQTYRQGSSPRDEAVAIDASNRLLWRMPHRRLDAESIRDASLSVAGLLNDQRGGPSFQDFRAYVHKNAQFFDPLDQAGPQFDRRSIYRMWARGGRNPLLDTLDCPDPSVAAPKRGSTTTPLQALSMLNGDFLLRMADGMAARLEREFPDDRAKQIERGCQLVWSRSPSADEAESMRAFAEKHGLSPLCRVLLNSNAFIYVD
jgi:cytochrome c553